MNPPVSEHERVQELLAGHALRALDPDDVAAVEALVAGHLPSCDACRRAREELEAVAGELAVAVAPRQPPRLLDARVRRRSRTLHRPARRLQTAVAGVLEASVAALALWSAHVTVRDHQHQARAAELISMVSDPRSQVVAMERGGTAAPSTRVSATYVPGRPRMYLFGYLPVPAAGRVYEVWLVRDGRYRAVGTFVPDGGGLVLVRIPVDPTGYQLLITEEPSAGSRAPSSHHVAGASL